MTDLAFLPAKKLAAKVRARKIGARELLEHYLARVERLDGRLNAVVARDFEAARKAAKALDNKKTPIGPLHGVPMTVKESFHVAGLPTTWGFPALRDSRPVEDALAVQRLKAAGAVVFGKTNVPISLGDWQSFNAIYGVTNNPWNPDYAPGGSSGGGAAALAAGLTGLEMGSDIGGSVRQPAHASGVFGHKPSWGLVPTFGHTMVTPPIASTADIAVIGPLARSAGDLALAMDLLAVPDPAVTAMRYDLPKPPKSLKGLRVAIWAEDAASVTDPEITTQLLALGRALKREGARVGFAARPEFDRREGFGLYLRLLGSVLMGRVSPEEKARIRAEVAAIPADRDDADVIIARMADATHGDWLGWNERRHRIVRAWGAFFKDWDVVLCPAHGRAAMPHRHDAPTWDLTADVGGQQVRWNELLFWPGITGAFHLPGTVAPLGVTSAGLPVGVQIVGPMYGDRTTIAVAAMLEKAWRGFVAPPGWN